MLTLPAVVMSQKISDEDAAKLYVEALTDFESSPLKIHEKDKKVLVTQSAINAAEFPNKIGQSEVKWIRLDDNLSDDLKGDIEKHNGRSVITISHRQSSADSVKVRVDQWIISNLSAGLTISPIDKKLYDEYLNKNHDYLFVKFDSKWLLIEKSKDLDPTTALQQEIEDIFQEGNRLNRQGKFKEALDHVERSMAMDSSLYQRYMFKADIKVELGMYESAISDITKCIERCDCSTREFHVPSYYLKRSEIHRLNNNYDAALDDINMSISLNPNAWKAYLARATVLMKLDDFQSALTDLNKSMELDQDQVVIYYLRGLVNIALENNRAACSDLKTAIEGGFEQPKNWVKDNCK